jgi:serine O-acetyltransferase
MANDDLPEQLARVIEHQMQCAHPTFTDDWRLDQEALVDAWIRTRTCVSHSRAALRGIDPMVSGHHATLLYFLSRALAARGKRVDATRVFLTNKMLHGIDLYHEIEMPSVFVIGHTVGMVFAKATYGPRCVFHQGCTVGRDGDDRPTLEEGVVMYPNSSILGACHVRANTAIAPGVQLVNIDTPGDCIVVMGDGGRPAFKPARERYADRYLVPMRGDA